MQKYLNIAELIWEKDKLCLSSFELKITAHYEMSKC
ncbi:MAG: hypothetical protein ETSY1_14715 [Candidatus Entotheonella factor]|uniref:Uncharacterized protein n=1 Tax=Entotheonella factor TaxID=1429438 RepID=W4LN32_ENTF1|nr:MAG: hypothetical protein ETSY1_14715 [Candidatus Entotheonella factor]